MLNTRERRGKTVIIAFESHNQVMRAYKLLPEGKIIPTPRRISKSCGLSIEIDGDRALILDRLKDAGIPYGQVEDNDEQHINKRKAYLHIHNYKKCNRGRLKRKLKKPRK
jgi:hypothetical protein